MNKKEQRSFLSGVPGWALALIAMFIIIALFIFLPERMADRTRDLVMVYTIIGVIDAVCCFFIISQNYRSLWYVILIINAPSILSAAISDRMEKIDWISYCVIWGVSLIASGLGAWIGKRKAIRP